MQKPLLKLTIFFVAISKLQQHKVIKNIDNTAKACFTTGERNREARAGNKMIADIRSDEILRKIRVAIKEKTIEQPV